MILCIDPGHGGDNTGCTYNGLREKDVTLMLANQLAGLLASVGIAPARTTRTDDSTVSLDARGRLSTGCDMALSIHADASPDPAAGHMSAYVLPGDDIGAAAALEVERAAPNILRPRSPGVTLSRPLDWTHRAYNVLRPHAPRPAVLVECGFLSNPRHAAYLQTRQGQAAVVLALAAGVIRAWEFIFQRKAAA